MLDSLARQKSFHHSIPSDIQIKMEATNWDHGEDNPTYRTKSMNNIFFQKREASEVHKIEPLKKC